MIPTFIIIGAPRAGTTSLYHYLRQHPQICMSSIKETNYYAYLASKAEKEYNIEPMISWPITDLKQYQALFSPKETDETIAFGEASPVYLNVPGVPKQIKAHVPNVKLIAVLRNPIDRAYSSYLKNIREGLETRTFEKAIRDEIQSSGRLIRSNRNYIRTGLYFQRLSEYLEYFESSQLKVDFYEDLENNTGAFLQNIFEFVDVNPNFQADTSVQFNKAIPSLIKRSAHRQRIKAITSRIRNWIPQRVYYLLLNFQYKVNASVASYPPLSKDIRLILRDLFVDDIENLQKLLDHDLSHWLAAE